MYTYWINFPAINQFSQKNCRSLRRFVYYEKSEQVVPPNVKKSIEFRFDPSKYWIHSVYITNSISNDDTFITAKGSGQMTFGGS